MQRNRLLSALLAAVVALVIPLTGYAEDALMITLPSPQMEGGKPLMEAVKARQSSRDFAPDSLPVQTLSNLLWVGFGISRPESGKRTAPSAHNWQEIDVYVATEKGVYRYDASGHVLHLILAQDIRDKTGEQPFVKVAPVNLIFVADLSKMERTSAADKAFYAAADAGFISQNVYLYCASEGLATVVRRWIDRPALAKAMNLAPHQEIMLAQTVGYPKK